MALFADSYRASLAKAVINSAELQQAQKNGRKFIIIPETLLPNIAAANSNGQAATGRYTLTWSPTGARQRRYAAIGGLGSAPPLVDIIGNVHLGSWDEYPYAATAEGGKGAYVENVPLRENWLQGGWIQGGVRVMGIKPGDNFDVYILVSRCGGIQQCL